VNHLNLNGKLFPADKPVILASNRSYRYGDGLFETMKMIDGRIILESLHFERLFSSLSMLQYEIPKPFTIDKLVEQTLHLCGKNACANLGRIRLSVSRGNGGLYDEDRGLQYLIEAWALSEPANRLNENGLTIDVYPLAKKNMDPFANLKTANFLLYSLAATYAKFNRHNDCLVLNQADRISDSSIANLFAIKKDEIITPALAEACINGVMRKHIIEVLSAGGYDLNETTLTIEELEDADEVFLSNAINGIRWVKQFRNKRYGNTQTTEIYDHFIKPIWL
jgi:branched-chain amino acid aminotransferase